MKRVRTLLNTLSLLGLVAAFVLAVVVPGCGEDPPPSLYDETYVSGPAPVVTAIDPADALAGVTELTITGQNFSDLPANNLVYFIAGGKVLTGTVNSASRTQLKVTAPILVADTVLVKVAVYRTELMSNEFLYKILAAVSPVPGIDDKLESTVAMTCDSAGNLYVSTFSGTSGIGVKKITPGGVRSDYAPILSSSVNQWTGMKFGPGGYLYTAANRTIIFRIPPGGGAPTTWQSGGGLTSVVDLDFDPAGNLWTAGNGRNVFRITQARNVKAFPDTANIRTVRVYDGYLYLGGKRDSTELVWRRRIVSADSLGPKEEYFNLSGITRPNGPAVLAITFSADGYMYLGTDADAAIYLVAPDRSATPYYPGQFLPAMKWLAWGKGTTLYGGRSALAPVTSIPFQINTQKQGAPYYGALL